MSDEEYLVQNAVDWLIDDLDVSVAEMPFGGSAIVNDVGGSLMRVATPAGREA